MIGVEGQEGGAGPEHREDRDDLLDAARQGDADHPFRSGAVASQLYAASLDARVEFGVRQALRLGGQRDRVGPEGDLPSEERGYVRAGRVELERSRLLGEAPGLLGGEYVQVAEGSVRVGQDGVQQPTQTVGEGVGRGGLEEARGMGESAVESGGLAFRGVALGEVKGEVEACDAGVEGLQVGFQVT